MSRMVDEYIKEWKEKGFIIHPILPIQKRYLDDWEHRFFVIPAGRRSRKTLIGRNKLFTYAMHNKGRYFCGAPTRQQAKEIFWKPLKEMAQAITFLECKPSESDLLVTLLNGSEIKVIGLDEPARVEGQPWHGCHITEIPNVKAQAWAENIRPVLSDTGGFAILDGVPDFRFPHYEDMAFYASGGFIPDPVPGGVMAENPDDPEWVLYTWMSSDVLPAKEIEAAKRQLPEQIFRQEYEGCFVRIGGRVWHEYTDDNTTDIEFRADRETYLCFDFNVNPMTCVLVQHSSTDTEGNLIYTATNEFVFHDSNTSATASHVAQWLADRNFKSKLHITGDYAGTGRHPSAGISNYRIIEEIFNGKYSFERVRIRPTKAIQDRVNALNGMFRNAYGLRRMYVNPKHCEWLHKDLTRQTRKEDGQLNDEAGMIGHRSDALSYFAYNYFPLERREIQGGRL